MFSPYTAPHDLCVRNTVFIRLKVGISKYNAEQCSLGGASNQIRRL